MKFHWMIAASVFALAACGGDETAGTADAPEPPAADTTASADEAAARDLSWAAAGDWRSEAVKARDAWRNPVETLEFFEVDASETVAEIWPGGGWYTEILGPYLKEGGGRFVAVGFDPEGSEFAANAMARYEDSYVSKPDVFGDIMVTAYTSETPPFAEDDSIDTILTFRNVHNWMAGGHEAKFFGEAYAALKPGGVLGVVEHRLPSTEEQDPQARTGYVHEDYVKTLAANAGFEFAGASEVNANPADTADHPFGVWTLPPSSRTAPREGEAPEGFDPAPYLEIGESDRMTLKFVKPAE